MVNDHIVARHAEIRGTSRAYKQSLRYRAAIRWLPSAAIVELGRTSAMYMAVTHVPENPAWIQHVDLLALTGEFYADTQELVYQKVKQHDFWHRPEERPTSRGGHRTLRLAKDQDWLEKACDLFDSLCESVRETPRAANLPLKFPTPTLMVGTFSKPELDLEEMIDAAADPAAFTVFEAEVLAPRSGSNDTDLWLVPASWYKTIEQDAFLFEDFSSLLDRDTDGSYTSPAWPIFAEVPRKDQLFRFGGSAEITTVLDCRPGSLKQTPQHMAAEKRSAKGKAKSKPKPKYIQGNDPVSPYGRTEFPSDVLADDHVELGLIASGHAERQAEAEQFDMGAALDALNAGLASR